jgi:hypothetical protein
MTRIVDLDAWRESRGGRTRLLAQQANGPRSPREKARDPVEGRLLMRSALESIRRREAEGRLVRVGPRTYELRTAAEAAKERRT